ncbi:MAG: GHKL domain-containing protein [Planctomycetes bacterium]|nr:GHKL domain-containing protein [Planctomycetota bacterium]
MDKLSEERKKRMIEAGRAVLNMSHSIKNVAQSMRSGREVMDKALEIGDLDVANRTWGILRQNLDRIEKLSLDTLKFSKDETPNLKPCHFNRLVESVAEILQPQADQRQIKILVQVDENIELVSMDSEQMGEVVMNLLINAIEAARAGTGEVAVGTELDAKSQQVILRVSDNGPGIKDIDRIFEPFHSTKPNVGTGLGLTITRQIIQNHAGTITVKSVPNEGAVFTVRIPITLNG